MESNQKIEYDDSDNAFHYIWEQETKYSGW